MRIWTAFSLNHYWHIFNILTSLQLFLSSTDLATLSNIPVHQRPVVTNWLIKCEAWKAMIYNGIISSQARAIKMELKLYWVLWYKTTPRRDLGASRTQKIFASKPEQLYMWESSESVSDSSALFKVLLCTDFFNPPMDFSSFFHFLLCSLR